jgi:hypothetical protein
MNTTARRIMPCAVLLVTSLSACGHTFPLPPDYRPIQEIDAGFSEQTRFIVDGETTRSQIAARWGSPTRTLGDGTIACYGFNLLDDVKLASTRPAGLNKVDIGLAASPRFAIIRPGHADDMDAQVIFVFDAEERVATHNVLLKKQIGGGYHFFLESDHVGR